MKRKWFPVAVVLVAAIAAPAVWNWPNSWATGTRFFICFSIIGLAIILTTLWLLGFSGLRWPVRLGALATGIAIAGVLYSLFEIEFDGDMYPMIHQRRHGEHQRMLEAHLAAAPKAERMPVGDITSDDYPGFRNQKRDGIVFGPKLATDWTKTPPKELWRQPCGGGYAGFAVVGDLAVTIEQRDSNECIVGYEAATGRERWVDTYAADFNEPLGGEGPRATPTIAGDAVYSLGARGNLVCLAAATGVRRWAVDLLENNSNLAWGQAGSPLIVDDCVVVAPGAQSDSAKGSAIRAYDRQTGKLVWATGDHRGAYSSPELVTLAGERQIIVLDSEAVGGYDPKSGQSLWQYPWPTAQGINVSQPLAIGEDRIFVSAGYDHGCALLRVSKSDDGWHVEPMWNNTKLRTKFSSPVYRDGAIYGLDEAFLVCLSAADGERKWKGNRYGYGQILLDGDVIVVGAENGRLALVEANPKQFREWAVIEVLPGNKNWNHLAMARGRAFVRNHFQMAAYRLPVRSGES